MLVTLVMLATCFGLLCGIGILFGIVGLLLKFGGKVLGACATILLPIGVIWLGFKIVFAVVPLLFKLVCAALICYLALSPFYFSSLTFPWFSVTIYIEEYEIRMIRYGLFLWERVMVWT